MAEEADPILTAYRSGTFFNPAWRHYDNPDAVVSCDRCGTVPLSSCIGHGTTDLCLACVAKLETQEMRKLAVREREGGERERAAGWDLWSCRV